MADRKTVIVLENIRSAHNVGAIFRTADGAGVDEVFLVGYTPCPIDRFGREQAEIKKTSLGASQYIPWQYFNSSEAAASQLCKKNIEIVVVEQTGEAVSYMQYKPQPQTAYVFGNEVEGVSAFFIQAASAAIEIPMSGRKESLNVSTTAGIILFNHRDN